MNDDVDLAALEEAYPALEDHRHLMQAIDDGRVEVVETSERYGLCRVRVGVVRDRGRCRDDVVRSFERDVGLSTWDVDAVGFVVTLPLNALLEDGVPDGWALAGVEEVEKA